jgi:hypothetical protein
MNGTLTTSKRRQLLLEIARCPVADACFTAPDGSSPCSKVVHAQGTGREAFHVPEPWNGDIERAPILFVSWNPSWNQREKFPTRSASDAEIVTFFNRRFEHTNQNARTWQEMRGIAGRLLGRDAVPGADYAVTDLVHCKSEKGKGASAALDECAGRYLPRVLAIAGATVIVGLGRDSRSTLAHHFGVSSELGVYDIWKGKRERRLVLLGAPGSAQRRRLRHDELGRAQSALLSQLEDHPDS